MTEDTLKASIPYHIPEEVWEILRRLAEGRERDDTNETDA